MRADGMDQVRVGGEYLVDVLPAPEHCRGVDCHRRALLEEELRNTGTAGVRRGLDRRLEIVVAPLLRCREEVRIGSQHRRDLGQIPMCGNDEFADLLGRRTWRGHADFLRDEETAPLAWKSGTAHGH